MSEAPDHLDDAVGIDAPAELSTEDRARAMGWKDDPETREALGDKFTDAEAFVKRGEEILPILQANNRKLEKALADSNKKTEKLEATLQRFAVHHDATEQRAYAKAVKDVQARIDAAAALGDVSAVREATDELVELNTTAKAGDAPAAPPANPDFDAWKADNPWWDTDAEMQAIAVAIAEKANEDGFKGKAQIAEVDRRLKARFPSLGKNPNRELPGSVEGAGQARRTSGKSFSDLPAEAKAMCDDFVKRIPGYTREKYVKEYQW